MAIGRFLNPEKEKVDNNVKVVIDKIVKAYGINDKTHKTDEEDMIIPKIRYTKVIQVMYKHSFYKEQNDNRNSE